MRPLVAAFLLAFPLAAHAVPQVAGCPVLPANNIWNVRVDALPVHPRSAAWVANVRAGGDGATRPFHMDFGSGLYPEPPDPTAAPIGIPYVVVTGTQPRVPVQFVDYADESDAGPYPVPPNAPIEGVGPPNDQGDRHVLVVDGTNCVLYEMGNAFPVSGGSSWQASGGAVFDLRSNTLRPETWTSTDAAGLPIFPGLARYDEVAAGVIEHALRFTADRTQKAYIWPARHFASSITDPNVAPMGARFRLKASVDITHFSPQARVIAQAMKTYGIMLADNGSSWFVSGAPDPGWNNTVLHELDALHGGDFEAVDTSGLQASPDSGVVVGSCNPGDGDGDGIPDCVEAPEGRDASVKDNDVFGNARLFAMQQYRDFLGREGDAAGISFWTQQLTSGAFIRTKVAKAFFDSPEFQGTISPVARLYFAYFLRIPDYAGLNYWIANYRAGLPLANISNTFAQSPEFTLRYGPLADGAFVDLVYNNVLGRAADAGGRAFWLNQLTTHAMTRGQVMLAFSEGAEYRALIANEVFVTMTYLGMLHREPEPGGFTFWVDFMDHGGSGEDLIDGFLRSQEYRNRFLP
jgi:hypothetical protein